ncbi:hypothetical protein Ndes2437A_g04727 [Nannochloris sp. 'desiccata']
MRRASQLIITSVKDFRHSVIRNAAKDAHINQINVFYMPICAKRFSSIPDSGGSFAHLPATAASDTEGDSGPSTSNSPSINTKHRSATELVWPMSRQQEKYAGKVYRALAAVLSHDSTLQDELIRELGFVIKEVRVSPDHAKAFILWDSYTGQSKKTTRALQKTTPRIRAGVAKFLKARNVPRLEFRLDKISDDDAELERIFSWIEEERNKEES